MTPGDWITLSAVVVALLLGLWANFQTRNIQQRERKQRLLNEIIDWLQDVNSCVGTREIAFVAKAMGPGDLATEYSAKSLSDLRKVELRIMYIKEISLTFGQNLHDSVAQVIEALAKHKDLFSQLYEGQDRADEVKKQADKLSARIEETIKQATKLKLK